MRLPDFICAGAQKCGTTWLYVQLSQHPQVFMPGKELNFFYRQLPESLVPGAVHAVLQPGSDAAIFRPIMQRSKG